MNLTPVSSRLRQAISGAPSVFWWVRVCEALDSTRELVRDNAGDKRDTLEELMIHARKTVSSQAGDPTALPKMRAMLWQLADRLDSTEPRTA